MLKTLKTLFDDQQGFVISAELVLVLTIGVLAMVVGLHSVAKSITMELNDLASAFGAINQSYSYKGLKKAHHAKVKGSAFIDRSDHCDCTPIIQRRPHPKVDPGGNGPESS